MCLGWSLKRLNLWHLNLYFWKKWIFFSYSILVDRNEKMSQLRGKLEKQIQQIEELGFRKLTKNFYNLNHLVLQIMWRRRERFSNRHEHCQLFLSRKMSELSETECVCVCVCGLTNQDRWISDKGFSDSFVLSPQKISPPFSSKASCKLCHVLCRGTLAGNKGTWNQRQVLVVLFKNYTRHNTETG